MLSKKFFRAEGTSSKGDEDSITFQIWNGESIGLLL